MREILFRGRRRDNREWVFGCYYKQSEFYGEKAEGIMIITSGESLCYDQALEYYAVSEETVGQFTGLHDSTKWEDLTDAEKLDFYHQHYIGEDGMSVRFQHIDDVKFLWKGKKIFEGDIVHVHDFLLKPSAPYHEFDGVIEHRDGSFVIVGETMTHYRWLDYDVTVLGNIHDNPELLQTA